MNEITSPARDSTVSRRHCSRLLNIHPFFIFSYCSLTIGSCQEFMSVWYLLCGWAWLQVGALRGSWGILLGGAEVGRGPLGLLLLLLLLLLAVSAYHLLAVRPHLLETTN